jgi:hypothetical protein
MNARIAPRPPSRRSFLGGSLASGVALFVGETAHAEGESPRRVFIQPLGAGISAEDVAFVEQSLLAFYDVEVVQQPRAALPESAFYAPRRRFPGRVPAERHSGRRAAVRRARRGTSAA